GGLLPNQYLPHGRAVGRFEHGLELTAERTEEVESSDFFDVRDHNDARCKDCVQRAAVRTDLGRVDEQKRYDSHRRDEYLEEHMRDGQLAGSHSLDLDITEHGTSDDVEVETVGAGQLPVPHMFFEILITPMEV